jgi:tetratricopeptide (TPR) repeat protein
MKKLPKEKMPGELKRWFLVWVRRQRTIEQMGALIQEPPPSVAAVLRDTQDKNTIRKSNANEVLAELARMQHVALYNIPDAIFCVFNYLELLRRSDASIYQRVEFSKIALDTLNSTEPPASPIARAFIHMTRGDAYLILRRYSQLLRPQSVLQPRQQKLLQDDPLVTSLSKLCNEAKRDWSFKAAQTEFEAAAAIFQDWERKTSISETSHAIALDRVYISYGFENVEADLHDKDLRDKVEELMAAPFAYASRIEVAHEIYASWRRMANLAEAMMVLEKREKAKQYALKAARMHRQLLDEKGEFIHSKWLRPLVPELRREISRISQN